MPSDEIMVSVEHVSMDFRLDPNRTSSLKEWAMDTLRRRRRTAVFHALRDVSFTVSKGTVMGLIGSNGAGKSTVLKVISGIYRPTAGQAVVRGSLVPMLELGAGFDPELSGRENILLNGAILGYPRDFLLDRVEEIITYSGLGAFVERPLKTYSSGMMARLAFSVATVVRPDILIVDEILAVGDEAFQRKSRARTMEMMGGGATVLFVSHNLSQIRQMCQQVVWLDHGAVREAGDAETVCAHYAEAVDSGALSR